MRERALARYNLVGEAEKAEKGKVRLDHLCAPTTICAGLEKDGDVAKGGGVQAVSGVKIRL